MLTRRQVPFFNYPALFASQEQELMALMRDVLSRGAYILQKDLKEFEVALARYLNVKHAFGMADGTNAIVLALRAAGIGPGDEVIVPSHTFIASVFPIKSLGATPVLVECGDDHLIDAQSAAAAVTAKTKAILPVHLNGRTCDMAAIQRVADKHGLAIIEDAAQGLGSKFKKRFAGTFGLAGTFSFYPAKSLGCFGDGGALVTNDDKVAEQVELWRDHGRSKEGVVVDWGTNCRLDNLQAAVLNLKLKSFDAAVARRREIARTYDQRLRKIEALILPPAPDAHPDHFDVYQNYEMQSLRRDELRAYLEQQGVRTLLQWGGFAVHQFKNLGFTAALPKTTLMTSRFIMLPMNTSLNDDDVTYICDVIEQFHTKA
ncbi:MAG TPA: DegT/DnrJ/EryC1/StrS family aminotransferase [Steroidobacteraceae bacterium]|nr:DegT/DnrJ/EryC1/StrS family aminotransferase [Steroidobacteraceae bacterium]